MAGSAQSPQTILAPVSTGELLDKIAILQIKTERIRNPDKRSLAEQELRLLSSLVQDSRLRSPEVGHLCDDLKQVNEALWEIEDAIRGKERAGEFDAEFIALARSVYKTNDRRAELKRTLNETLGSTIMEVKDYDDVPASPRQ
jgi:hypothetical protein